MKPAELSGIGLMITSISNGFTEWLVELDGYQFLNSLVAVGGLIIYGLSKYHSHQLEKVKVQSQLKKEGEG